jgi:hypothetical protein
MKSTISISSEVVNRYRSNAIVWNWRFVALYLLCLLPLSIAGLSVNYIFAVIPLGLLILGRQLKRLTADVVLFICGCTLVFALGSLYQIELSEFFGRRIVSFVLFISIFSLCFVKISQQQFTSFKLAVVIAAILISLRALAMFVGLGSDAQAFESKDIVGSQRYGFVYVLAFWIVWFDRVIFKQRFVRLLILSELALGISLTFSRASIVAFAVTTIVAVVYEAMLNRQFFLMAVKRLVAGVVLLAILTGVIYLFAPIIFEFVYVRLIDYADSGGMLDSFGDSETSEGARLFIWGEIFSFVLANPITGSGFLGVWILNLFGDFSGSAHSQYFDIFFRLGPLLFFWYIYYLVQVARYLRKIDTGMFVGFIGVLVFGIFHETFKESHGAFILAMLLALSIRRDLLSGRRFN